MRILLFIIAIITIYLNLSNVPLNDNLLRYINLGVLYLSFFNLIMPIVYILRLKSPTLRMRNDLMKNLDIVLPNNVFVYSSQKDLKQGTIAFETFNKNIILISEPLEQQLSRNEMKFVILHECGHIRNKHLKKNIISLTLVLSCIPIFIYFMSTTLQFRIDVLIPFIIFSVLLYVSGYVFHFKFVMRREHDADDYAANFVAKEDIKSLFTKLKTIYENDQDSYNIFNTHPSLSKREKYLTDKKWNKLESF